MRLIHIYCGNGKGTTTATTTSLGLAIRVARARHKIHIIQLLKGSETLELESLKLLTNIRISLILKNFGFTFSTSEQNKQEIR